MHEKWYCIQFCCIWHSQYKKDLLTRRGVMMKTCRSDWKISYAIPIMFCRTVCCFSSCQIFFFFKFCHSYVLTIFLCPIFHRKCWFMLMKWPVYLIVCMFTLEQIHIFFFQVLHLFRMNTYINQIPAELRLSHFSMRNCKQQQWLQDNHCFVDLNALAIMMKYMWFSRVLDLRILNLVNDEHH